MLALKKTAYGGFFTPSVSYVRYNLVRPCAIQSIYYCLAKYTCEQAVYFRDDLIFFLIINASREA